MLLRRRAATAAAATGLGLTRRRSEAEAKPAPHVTGVLVLFRHGARSPIWKLPDEDGQVYETITAAPAHAASVVVHDAVRAWSDKRGLMTTVGWAQGEALGRRLQATYGTPSEPPAVRSTDMMRTVLTAHAVLTGLYAPGADAAGLQIQVEKRTAMHCPLWCEPLAELMASGRAEARRDTGSAHFYAAVQQQATLSGAVRALTPPPPGIAAGSLPPARVTAIGVHDDCQARRFHGKAPSAGVDVALCDAASREAAREINWALAHGGDESVRLSAGPLCAQVGELVRQLATSCARDPARPPKLSLLSGHDTTLFLLINALEGSTPPCTRLPDYCTRDGGRSAPSESATELLRPRD